MADRIETFDVTIPAGTAIASATTTALTFNVGIVERIEVKIPPGPSGLVGFRIQHSGEPVIPYNKSRWIIADDEKLDWPIEGFPEGSAWAVRAYNTDVFDHTLYFRFLVNEVQRGQSPRPQLEYIPPQAIAEDFI